MATFHTVLKNISFGRPRPIYTLKNVDKKPNNDSLSHSKEIFPNKLPQGLPAQSIDHNINLVPGAKPLSIPHYRLSRTEEDEIA